jgi:hypothetical protein
MAASQVRELTAAYLEGAEPSKSLIGEIGSL